VLTSDAAAAVVRSATRADEPFLVAISARLADFPVPHWRTAQQIAEADFTILREALAHPDPATLFLIVELPGLGPVGTVFATTRSDYFTGEAHAHVEMLALEPRAEGRGLARLLMDRAEQWSRSRGYRRITLNVFDTNTRAAELYRKLGYEAETVRLHKSL
jgi:ribosomal protein S18 acetylase RimI-like enzyme